MNISDNVFSKAESVLFYDKVKTPNGLSNIVSTEVFYILKQFFDIVPNSFWSGIHVEKNGQISIDFSFKATRVLNKKESIL